MTLRITAIFFILINAVLAGTPIKHSFLGVSKGGGAVIFDEDGKQVWKSNLPSSDGQVLENGNILLAVYPTKGYPKGGIVEIDRKSGKVVFQFQGAQKEVSSVVKLDNGDYLFTELGPKPSATTVSRKGKETKVTRMPLQCQLKNAHMQVRMLRPLPNGNLISPQLFDFAVKEYKPKTGEVVKVLKTDDRGRQKKDWPFTAIRLDNGNTLISNTNGHRIIEVAPDNSIVWCVTNEDLRQDVIKDACGMQLLPNGNIVITSYYARGNSPKLIEITKSKEIVWTFDGYRSFHSFQILTTNGEPVDSKFRR